ncbi:MAG: NADH-quinone oxidoreductase subunit NuoK [Paludibacter sp.]|jgi:NADH-quinone oxidoreductase subunit K
MGEFFTKMFTGVIPLEAYIAVSLVMFFAGIYGFMSRKSLLMILISIELILNATDVNFVVFNKYLYPEHFEGFYFALFTIAISACETAVAIAIVINIYRNLNNVNVDSLRSLSEPDDEPQTATQK